MGLFSKKSCSICGGEIGLLGNRKLEDGNMCKECAAKLSPFFSERRHSTVAEIEKQLEYRAANEQEVASFNPTLTLGKNTTVAIDESQGKFIVTSSSKWREQNPDVIKFTDVTGCDIDIRQDRDEEMREGPDGKEVSYNPPRYTYSYDFYIQIRVNNPYFDEINFKVNDFTVKEEVRGNSVITQHSADYQAYVDMCNEIKESILNIRTEARSAVEEAAKPKVAVTCKCCGATTIPDASGRCEFCGGAAE